MKTSPNAHMFRKFLIWMVLGCFCGLRRGGQGSGVLGKRLGDCDGCDSRLRAGVEREWSAYCVMSMVHPSTVTSPSALGVMVMPTRSRTHTRLS